MAEKPPQPMDSAPNEPKYAGGWHKPAAGVWRGTPRPTTPQGSWRVVRAFSEKLSERPANPGDWHLPAQHDTTFKPGDQIQIAPERLQAAEEFRPEDMLLVPQSAAAPVSASPSPEELLSAAVGLVESDTEDAAPSPPASELLSASPLLEFEKAEEASESSELADLERQGEAEVLETEEEDDDDSAFSMSELIALSSLVEQAPPSSIKPTAAGATATGTLAPVSTGATGPQPASESESLAQTGAENAADYARKQLEILSGSGAQPATTGAQSPAADSSAADYARQQLEQLGITGAGAATGAAAATGMGAATSAQPALSPYQQALAGRFRETEDKVRVLRAAFQNQQMTREQLQEQLRQLMILDEENGVWWMMGVETDQWYRFEGNDWVVAAPPYTASGTVGAQQPGRQPVPTATSNLNPADVIGGSLPYISSQPSAVQPDSFGPTFGVPLDTSGFSPTEAMPLPDPNTPIRDENATLVGAGAYLDPYQRNAAPTQINLGEFSAPPTQVNQQVNLPDDLYYADQPATPAAIGPDIGPGGPAYDLGDPSAQYAAAAARARQNTASTVIRLALVAVGIVVLLLACGAGFLLTQYNGIAGEYTAQIAALANYQPEFQTAKVLDVNGNLIAEINSQDAGARTNVPLERISPFMIHAVVSLENERFFEDPGWDWIAIGRAFLQNLSAGAVESGASTITQQIAEQLILRQPTTTPDLKLREIIIASQIAQQYTKQQILELYLNEIFFGNQSYGVEAASQFYFNVSANDLNMPQAALLAGMIASPVQYNPVRLSGEDQITYDNRRTLTFQRMEFVMQRMQEVGCLTFQSGAQPFCVDAGVIRQQAINLANVKAARYLPRSVRFKYPHFVQFVVDRVNELYPGGEMFRLGFVIRTTLNPAVQDAAEAALDDTMARLITTRINTGSVMVSDPRNGAIRAMVGSPDFANEEIRGQVNGALTFQQPGSSIKPIVYTGALEGVDSNGDGRPEYLTAASILWDVQTTFANTNPAYTPVNFDGVFHGPVSVRTALQNSYNIPAIKAYQFIGETKFRDVANRMGLVFPENAIFGLPTGIGATEVTLYSMMQAYGTLANSGIRAPLYAIESITDASGNAVPIPGREAQQVVQPQVAYLMSNILSDDQARGPAFGLNGPLTINGLPTSGVVAAKTGTTDGSRDLWTMGYTRNAVVGVWLGRPDDQNTLVTDGGYGSAAPLWNRVMNAVLNTMSRPEQFGIPPGVIAQQICPDTGTLPPANCPSSLRNELFIEGLPALSADNAFVRQVTIDTWTGLLGNNFCPDNQQAATVLNISDPAAVTFLNSTAGQAIARRLGITTATIANPPTTACDLNTEVPIARIIAPTDNGTVSGVVQITGAAQATSFNRFELYFAPENNPAAVTPIGSAVTTPQTSGLLGQWDTTSLNGRYILYLRMFSSNAYGGNLERRVTVNVVNTPPPTPTLPQVLVPTQFFPTATVPFGPTSTPIPFDEVQPGG
jgi:membrane peptidoglycan carboxypeptidase